MNLNAINSVADTYSNYTDTKVDSGAAKAPAANTTENTPAQEGVVYEPSANAQTSTANKIYKPNQALVDQMKADAKEQQDKLMSYVQQMLSGQGNALASSDDIWKRLASGNFTVSELAKEDAQKAISEDGYWGVKQTSDRIIEFAKALSGGDPSKIDSLRSAFEKGFGEATKTWGKELPDISNQTYKAVMEKFDKWAEEGQKAADEAKTTTEEA